MARLVLLLIALFPAAGCVMRSTGFEHGNNRVQTPLTVMPVVHDEPAVLFLVEGIQSTKAKLNEKNENLWNGSFRTEDGFEVTWLYEPQPNAKSKTGVVMLCKVDPENPDETPKLAAHSFDTKSGKAILVSLKHGELLARQADIPAEKLKATFEYYRGGFGNDCVMLESEKSWKIAAGIPAFNEFLQDVRGKPDADGQSPPRNIFDADKGFQSLYASYKKKEGSGNRGINFYYLAAAFENVQEQRKVKFTQQEVLNYLGEPDDVTEHVVLGQRKTSRLVYSYRLTRSKMKGQVVNIEFEQGLFTKFNYHPEAQPDS